MRLFIIWYLLLASSVLADGPVLFRDTTTKVTTRTNATYETATGDINMNGDEVKGLPASPVGGDSAASKTYVDANDLTVTGTDNQVVRMDGTGAIQNSGVTIDDTNNMVLPGTLTLGNNGTSASMFFDISLAGTQDPEIKWENNEPGHGPGWVGINNNGDVKFFIDGSDDGLTNTRFLINPQENIGASATARDYQLGFGDFGTSQATASFVFNVGTQVLPSPLQDESHSHVSIVLPTAGGIETGGPVMASAGSYFGALGRPAVVAKGQFLGADGSAYIAMIPRSTVHTCTAADLTETGGEGSGSDPCIAPLHQFAGANPDSYAIRSFGIGNDPRLGSGRPYIWYMAKRMDSLPSVTFGSLEVYASQDFPMVVWDAMGLNLPSGPLQIGGAGSTNGIPGGFVDGDPIIALAYNTDLDGSIGAFDSPISWGDDTDAIRFGAYKQGNTDVPHFRADHDISAVAFREPGVQLMAASATVSKATARVRLDGNSATVVATLFNCGVESDGSKVRFVATDVTNPVSVAADAGDSILGGAPTFTVVGDSATFICYGAGAEWEVY